MEGEKVKKWKGETGGEDSVALYRLHVFSLFFSLTLLLFVKQNSAFLYG